MLGETTATSIVTTTATTTSSSKRQWSFWLLLLVFVLGAAVNLRLVHYYAGYHSTAISSLDDDAVDAQGYNNNHPSPPRDVRLLLHTSPDQRQDLINDKDGVQVPEVNETQQLLLEIFRSRISPDRPLLFLDLTNTGWNAIQRYISCAGLDVSTEVGSLYTHRLDRTDPLARCIQRNVVPETVQRYYDPNKSHHRPLLQQYHDVQAHNPTRDPLLGCGNYSVWTGLNDVRPPTKRSARKCFVPTLSNTFLHQLAQNYPNATIVHLVHKNTQHWYNTLRYDLKEAWPLACNGTDDFNNASLTFPQSTDSETTWIQFYHDHNQHLRNFAQQQASSWTYLELELEQIDQAANTLQRHLGLDAHCWTSSVRPPPPSKTNKKKKKKPTSSPPSKHTTKPPHQQPPPNEITYPLLVTALPKSGTTTTHNYFKCGQGRGTGAHQWTWRTSNQQQLTIGACMQQNIHHNRSLFHDCGLYRVWTDAGVIQQGKCFYPSMNGGALEAFYQAHPYGTLMNVVRNDTAWVSSCMRWNSLPKRWSRNMQCQGFPAPGSSTQEWIDFSVWHRHTVRTFAHEHPTLTYVEVSLEDPETPAQLEHIFGFPKECWGQANVNQKNPDAATKGGGEQQETQRPESQEGESPEQQMIQDPVEFATVDDDIALEEQGETFYEEAEQR